jgi:hypothetical protein
MSSISSSDRSRTDDRVVKQREEYDTKETENQKKQKAEVEALNKKHNAELNRISDDFGKEMETIKQHYRETLTDRDQANIRKVDDVRTLYRDQLKRKIEENESDKREMRNANSGELNKQKSVMQSQRENLMDRQSEELKTRDDAFRNMSDETRNQMKTSLSEHDDKLKNAHAKELNATISDRDTQLGNKERDNRELRKAFNAKLKTEKMNRESEVSHWQQKNLDTTVNLENRNAENLESNGEVLQGEVDRLHRKFDGAIEKKSDQLDGASDNLRRSVNDRLDGQVRSKQSQISRLTNKLNNEMVNNERLRGIERRALQDEYGTQLDIVEQQKTGAVDQAREISNKRINDGQAKNEKILRSTNREYKSDSDIARQRNREDREMLMQQHHDTVEHVTGSAEDRIRKITKVSQENQDANAAYFDTSLDTLKDTYAGRVEDQRDRNVDERVQLSKNTNQRFRNMEKSFNQKVDILTDKYESKISQMKENHDKELKRIEGDYGTRLIGKDKEQKLQADSIEMKYEAKIAQMNDAHADQLDRMNRRHHEDMQNLATKMSNYSKKA